MAEQRKPNIIVILADDLGYGDVSSYWDTDADTPVIDRLANQGVRFTDCNVAPLCAPTRSGVMTGLYSMENGMWRGPSTEHKVGDRQYRGIDASFKFLPQLFKDAGYATGAYGKWHLGYEDWNTPNARGFDDYLGFIGGASPYDYNPARKNIMHNDALYDKPFEHTTDLFTEGALNFIEANKERPFFLYVAYNAVHGPLWSEDRPRFSAKQEWLDKYADKGLDNDRLDYVAIIAHMDASIGKIVSSLETNGIAQDTLIVFMSDNGACLTNGETKGHFPGNNGPFRNGKGSTYNGGITVPMIMYWPGTIPPRGVVEDAVTYVDLFPTILTAAQMPVPEFNGAFKPRGMNLLDTAKSGGSQRIPERTYFVELVGKFASRKGSWKLVGTVDGTNGNWTQMVDNIDSKKFELYNLKEDIGERNDLSEAEPQIHEELREQIVEYFKSIAGRS